MSKYIKIPENKIDDILNEIKEKLKKVKMTDGKIKYNDTVGTLDKKASVVIDDSAWEKIKYIMSNSDKEIAWHCLAERGETDSEFIIKDAFVYPQKVTGVTVTTDENEYRTWVEDLDDDTRNNMKCQMHSHVNMGVSPSGTDLENYNNIIQELDEDSFYIFMIWNKKYDCTCLIYDMQNNIMYDNNDVIVYTSDPDLSDWWAEVKALVKEESKIYNNTSISKGKSNYWNSIYGVKDDDDDDDDDKKSNNKKGTKNKGSESENYSGYGYGGYGYYGGYMY